MPPADFNRHFGRHIEKPLPDQPCCGLSGLRKFLCFRRIYSMTWNQKEFQQLQNLAKFFYFLQVNTARAWFFSFTFAILLLSGLLSAPASCLSGPKGYPATQEPKKTPIFHLDRIEKHKKTASFAKCTSDGLVPFPPGALRFSGT